MENNALNNLIASQQAGHENEPRWMIGEHLKEIAEEDKETAERLKNALEAFGNSLKKEEK